MVSGGPSPSRSHVKERTWSSVICPEEEEDAAETAELVQRAERKAVTIAGDIRDEQHCAAMVDRVYDEFGKLDILVNNAAFQMTHDSIEEFSTEEFDRTFKTNVYAMFWLCRAALPRMQAGSAIINTASIQAFDPSPNLLAYAPTKAAIVEFHEGAVADRDEERRAGQRGRARVRCGHRSSRRRCRKRR